MQISMVKLLSYPKEQSNSRLTNGRVYSTETRLLQFSCHPYERYKKKKLSSHYESVKCPQNLTNPM
jgi:hypothetical protein